MALFGFSKKKQGWFWFGPGWCGPDHAEHSCTWYCCGPMRLSRLKRYNTSTAKPFLFSFVKRTVVTWIMFKNLRTDHRLCIVFRRNDYTRFVKIEKVYFLIKKKNAVQNDCKKYRFVRRNFAIFFLNYLQTLF